MMRGSYRPWQAVMVIMSATSAILPCRSTLSDEHVTTSAELQSSRPNIVLILADDQSYRDFGFMGNELVQTPALDRLAAQSARFPLGYVPMSVCRPSLATLLTGLYPHQHGIHFNHPPPGLRAMRAMTADAYHRTRAATDGLIEQVPTLPRILARHGYACLQTGKHWEGSFRTAGFTHGMTLGRPAKRLGPITGTRQQENGQWVAHGNGDAGLVIGRETLQPIFDFVAAHAGRQPFFVWYAPFLPHTPFDAPSRFRDLYADSDIPPHLLPYYAEISRFDETVGELMHYLENHELLDSTLIVFAADNGFRPDRRRFERQDGRSKLSPYEDGLRTPILIRLAGHTLAAEHPQPVETVDIVPTILTAVGLADEVTASMPGRTLWPAARGQAALAARPVFGAIYPNDAHSLGEPAQHVRARWVRDGNWKLILPGPANRPLPAGLFDLRADPREEKNMIAHDDQADRLRHMQALLDQWWPAGDNHRVTRPQGDHHE